jgi:hypothetical protein
VLSAIANELLQDSIRMCLQFPEYRGVPERCQIDAHTLFSGKFHSGHEIRVPGYQYHCFRHFLEGNPSNIQTDSHIHALLIDGGEQISRVDLKKGGIWWNSLNSGCNPLQGKAA